MDDKFYFEGKRKGRQQLIDKLKKEKESKEYESKKDTSLLIIQKF